MTLKSWNFYDANGDSITQGWQGYEDQARKHARQLANDRGVSVEFNEYGADCDEDGEPVQGEIVEPEIGEDN